MKAILLLGVSDGNVDVVVNGRLDLLLDDVQQLAHGLGIAGDGRIVLDKAQDLLLYRKFGHKLFYGYCPEF